MPGIDVTTDLTDLRRRSRDYFWYSPILNEQLKDKLADIVVTRAGRGGSDPRLAAACARHRIPLTVRGGATGNYGQCVPLEGGVVLDMAAMNAIEWQKPGACASGRRAAWTDIDRELARPNGWELRMHPSTKRSAPIGGFVAGGSGGIGSRHLRRHARARQYPRRAHRHGGGDAAHHRAARRRGAEDQPRLRHDRHHHGAGNAAGAGAGRGSTSSSRSTTSSQAVRFGDAIALADGIVKKLLSAGRPGRCRPISRALRTHCPEGKSLLIGMIARDVAGELREPAAAVARRRITYTAPTEDVPGKVPLYEYTWNHTTLQVLKVGPRPHLPAMPLSRTTAWSTAVADRSARCSRAR